MRSYRQIFSVVFLTTLIIGCIDEQSNDTSDDVGSDDNDSDYYHRFRLIISPHNLSVNSSPEYSVGFPFRITQNDPYYWINQSTIKPSDCEMNLVTNSGSMNHLKISYQYMVNFSIGLVTYENKMEYQQYYDFCSDAPRQRLNFYYDGNYEYLDIEYYSRTERSGGGSGSWEQSTYDGKITNKGWTSLDTLYTSDDWQA